jgi:hypothetical protein
MATCSIPELLTKGPTCPDCGQKLNRAMAYEGAPSNTKGELLWCANPDCQSFGLMLDALPPAESETSRQA